MKRYLILMGDKTTAGGTVLEGNTGTTNNGTPMSYHGARIYCPACQSTGHACNVPPFHTMLLTGKQALLNDDLCLCKCSPPPRLIASQHEVSMSFEESNRMTSAQTRLSGLAGSAIAGLISTARASATDDARMEQMAYGDPRFWTAQVGPPAPGTASPISTAELSGSQWISRYPTSTSAYDLISPFREHVDAFIAALQAGGASVSISATLRPPERVYLMHYSYAVAGGTDPSSVPPMDGVDIDWVHRDSSGNPDLPESQLAAQQMVNGYGIAYPPALSSRHSEGRAIDMTITNFSGKTFTNGSGTNGAVANQGDLEALGSSYGVIKLRSDPPHWSDDGH
jgi:uncharacterized Zn-binding protein involved in type VI secretion/D-alanyl-D-alanine dipeptidase